MPSSKSGASVSSDLTRIPMRNPSSRIPVAITLGDPRGVGPEVVLKALALRGVARGIVPVVVGSPAVVRRAQRLIGGEMPILPLSPGELPDMRQARGVYVLCPKGVRPTQTGSGDARLSGRMSFACVREGVRLCAEGGASALVTAPVSKASLKAAGTGYVGHTEMLRVLSRAKTAVMMFAWAKHRVSLVTTHVPLSAVSKALTKRRVETTISLTERALRFLYRVSEPRMAVLSFNPHKGENGLLGREEQRVIEPAILSSRRRGLDIHGPFAADSFFSRSEWKTFHAIVAMYHDQGLIPAKILGGEKAVNVTLGLPFVRTSPGHGTAEDIAWKGIANPGAMASAILLAARLARNVRVPLAWD